MNETNQIEKDLRNEALQISQRYNGAPVVIIVGEMPKSGIPRCMTASTLHQGEGLPNLLGIIEAAKQIETYKHMMAPRK